MEPFFARVTTYRRRCPLAAAHPESIFPRIRRREFGTAIAKSPEQTRPVAQKMRGTFQMEGAPHFLVSGRARCSQFTGKGEHQSLVGSGDGLNVVVSVLGKKFDHAAHEHLGYRCTRRGMPTVSTPSSHARSTSRA